MTFQTYKRGQPLEFRAANVTTRRPDARKQILENVSASGFRSWTMDSSLTFNNNREWKFPQPLYLQAQGAIPEAVSGEHNKVEISLFYIIIYTVDIGIGKIPVITAKIFLIIMCIPRLEKSKPNRVFDAGVMGKSVVGGSK